MTEKEGFTLKLQPASRRELRRISAGVLIGGAAMEAVFAAVGRWDWPVLWGGLLGCAVAIGNFYYLAVSIQKAAAAQETRAMLVMRSSYAMRMLIAAAAIILGVALPVFHWLAVLIPLLLPRLTILIMQITGVYKPDKPAKEPEETEG